MRNRRSLAALGMTCAIALLSACGGGGGGGGGGLDLAGPGTPPVTEPPATTPPPAPTSLGIFGVAAIGRPFAGALVTVYASGTVVGTTTARADGTYALDVPATVQGPLVVEAALDTDTLVSLAPEARSGRVNVTPLTSIIAAQLAPNGDPLALKTDASRVTPAAVAQRVEQLQAVLQPLRTTVGDQTDPLTGVFAADGSGHDQTLNTLDVQIRPAGTQSNIEITYKTAVEQGDPPNTTFTSAQAQVQPLPAIAPADLPPPNLDTMIDGLTQRMTACFALPLSQRVRTAGAGDTAATGTAADVVAPECRTLFVGDDPAGFLNNGARVGRDARGAGAFNALFRASANGARFDDGRFEFRRANPERDVVFTYKATGQDGSQLFDQIAARIEGDRLKLVGNQYIYSARVRPHMEHRDFLNQPEASYVLTGYAFIVANELDSAGNPIFSKVVVTPPTPRLPTFTLKPNGGRDLLTLTRGPDGPITQTAAIALAARFRNGDTRSPATFDTGLLFQSPEVSDDELRDTPAMGVWSVEFFHADATRPNVVQRYRTIARAATMAEALQQPMAQLTPEAAAELRGRSNLQAGGLILFGSGAPVSGFPLTTQAGGDFWQVAPVAQAPTIAQLFGRGPDPDGSGPQRGAPFSDIVSVSSIARRAPPIQCTRLGNADTHCAGSQFAEGSSASVLQLLAITRKQEELSKASAVYLLLPR